ncbi:MAG: hypothetical protein TEF_08555 [Rhizobiales bacterium NRL2]|nr:MAG: hypothetical protein TEF_08555 [Rhizobiales bacterium NRL2]
MAHIAIIGIALGDLDPWFLSGVVAAILYVNLTRHPETLRKAPNVGLILWMLFISAATAVALYGAVEIIEQILVD